MAGLGNIPTSGVWTEEIEVTALRRPYPGAPTPVSQSVPVCQGFNVPKSVAQDSQAQIPQFFNFIGSSDAGAQAVKKTYVNVSVPPSEPVAEKSPEEIQRGVSELLQRLDNEQKAQEKRAEEERRRFQAMMNSPKTYTGRLSDGYEDEYMALPFLLRRRHGLGRKYAML